MRAMLYPPALRPGDRVAVLSPSGGLPERYPAVFDLGLRRLAEQVGVIPVEYPTTRVLHSSMEARARDLHAAFADPDIQGIFCSIGGGDQIKLLRHLDADLIRAHPKRFFGYSDATNLELYLWNLGIVSFYGAAVMVQLGMQGGLQTYTQQWLERALYSPGEVEVQPRATYGDENLDWNDPALLHIAPRQFPNAGWDWVNPGAAVEGITWGGCLEILDLHLRANRYLLPNEAYAGTILLLETSEELPDETSVYRVLMGMGERGLLRQFAAVLVGRPKAWSFERPLTLEQKLAYTHAQREAMQRAFDEYHPGVPVIYNMDFGHTDPQWIVPVGGVIRIDGVHRQIWARY
ncbi:MAG: LD-carboxypeptidase [Ktedonobacterales bacterium]